MKPAAIIKMLNVKEKPKLAIPKPAMALPTADESSKTEMFLVASFSSRLGDSEKIAVLVTAQYEDSFKASRTLPNRNIGVEVAIKYTKVDRILQGQFNRI